MTLAAWDFKKRNARIVDLSHYDIMPDFDELKRGGVDAVIFKDDDMTVVHVARARAAGLLVMALYWWVDPNKNGAEQARTFLEHLKLYGIPCGFGDLEQEYKYFTEYQAYLLRRITWAQVTKIPPADIRRVFLDYMNTLNSGGAQMGIKTGLYSRRELLLRIFNNKDLTVKGVARSAAGDPVTDLEWLEMQRQWMAHYSYYPASVQKTMGWAAVWSKSPTLPFAWYYAYDKTLTSPDAWQWTGDRLIIPGVKCAADLTIFRGTFEELCAWLGISVPVSVVQPVPFLTVYLNPQKTSALNTRPGPADFSRVVGIIHAGEAIYLTKDVRATSLDGGQWGKLWNQDAWINLGYIITAN